MDWKEISFPDAISQCEELLAGLDRQEVADESVRRKVSELLSSNSGARGFFVAYLTGDFSVADEPPAVLLAALREHPPLVCDLLARNLVMSTTIAPTHERKGDGASARGSQRVARRTRQLIASLKLPEMTEKLVQMRGSIVETQGPFVDFLKRWNYDEEQLKLAEEAVTRLLDENS